MVLEALGTYFTPVQSLELWSRACQGPQRVKAQGLFCVGSWRVGVRRVVEKHWRRASLLGAQASGCRAAGSTFM